MCTGERLTSQHWKRSRSHSDPVRVQSPDGRGRQCDAHPICRTFSFRPYIAMLNNLIIFVLAAFVGTEILSKVPQTLHTPLMSGANAISGITIVGAIVAAGMTSDPWSIWIGFAAVVVATINVVGGFLVTDRMLEMFGQKKKSAPAEVDAAAAAQRTDGTAN